MRCLSIKYFQTVKDSYVIVGFLFLLQISSPSFLFYQHSHALGNSLHQHSGWLSKALQEVVHSHDSAEKNSTSKHSHSRPDIFFIQGENAKLLFSDKVLQIQATTVRSYPNQNITSHFQERAPPHLLRQEDMMV